MNSMDMGVVFRKLVGAWGSGPCVGSADGISMNFQRNPTFAPYGSLEFKEV